MSDWWYLVPAKVRAFPADLAATIAGTLLTILVVVLPVVRETPLRIVVGLVFVLFLPGYAFVALLFPEAGEPPGGAESNGEDAGDDRVDERGREYWTGDGDADGSGGADRTGDDAGDGDAAAAESTDDDAAWYGVGEDRGIDGIERVALSFGLSIAIVPLIGLALNFTPWGIRLAPILASVSGFTVLCAIGAAYRRWELPPEERFRVPYREWLAAARAEVFQPDDRLDAALNVVLALSILLAVGSVGYAIAVPPDGERFTEFYLLTEDDDGELVAAGYPEELEVGESADLVVGVANHEHETEEYTVVVQLQEVETEGNETTVVERQELDRFETSLAHNETWHHHHEVTPTMAGEDLRLQYLLYRGEPPAEPDRESAYRDLHLWIDVHEGE